MKQNEQEEEGKTHTIAFLNAFAKNVYKYNTKDMKKSQYEEEPIQRNTKITNNNKK